MRIWLSVVAMGVAMAMGFSANAVEPDAQNPDAVARDGEDAPEPVLKSNLVVRAVLEQTKSTKKSGEDARRSDLEAINAYYTSTVEEPLWVSSQGELNARAKTLFGAFSKADDWGMSAKDFVLPKRVSERTSAGGSEGAASVEDIAELEIAVSALALKYARYARGGRIREPSAQLSSYIDRAPNLLEPGTVLEALAKESAVDTYLAGLHPQHPQFEKLRKKLLEMRSGVSEEQRPEDIKLPANGPILRNGKTHKDVALLRKRLSVPVTPKAAEPPKPAKQTEASGSDDRSLKTPVDPALVFDQVLEDAVRAFQKDNGLSSDGLVGRGTRRALNGAGGGAVTEEVLLANMEQWRWMPSDLGALYVTVNIPEYKVRVVKGGTVIHEERAIVGKTNNQTPVFSDELETVVVHPSWGVPNSIKVRELLPNLARGGTSFQRQGLRLKKNGRVVNPASVNWAYEDIRKYDVYQPPGRRNVLGVVKFLFPNKHQVYMHDTPTKHLFKQSVRTYSHGCMRLRNPLRLAEIVLEHDKDWNTKEVAHLVKSGPENNQIKLDTKIPVHVTYFTVVIDDDGSVRRLKDIYGHEKRVKLALAGKFSQIARGRDHLAPVRLTRRTYSYQPVSMNEIFQNVFGGF